MITFDFDIAAVEGLGVRLAGLSGEALGLAAIAAVNAVTTRFDAAQRAGQIADINLSAGYVDSKTRVKLAADPNNAQATITTAGDLTVMDRFPIEVVRNPSGVDRAGVRLGARSAGLRVAIKPSSPADVDSWFLMRLANTEGRAGVFHRSITGKVTHKYGPSPYSLFRHQIKVGEESVLDDLQSTGITAIADAVEKALP